VGFVGALTIPLVAAATQLSAQTAPGRETIEALEYPALDFRPPRAERHESSGVPVLLLEDHTLPLVTFYLHVEGGYGLFERDTYAAASGLPALLRYGGTTTRTPESVDEALETHSFQVAFGSGGGSVTSSLNTLTGNVEAGLELWSDLITRPAFDPSEVEAWRGRQLEGVLRRRDDPARLAYSELNRLLYGDHPIGWEMDTADLAPGKLTAERLHRVHSRIVCRDHVTLGVSGDVTWSDVQPLVAGFVNDLPKCAEDLPEPPEPVIRRIPGVYIIEKDIEQAVIAMAHPSSVRLADDDLYYSAMIGNSILGAGGFSSRILGTVRTEEGFAYSASSLWTTPRDHEGLIGAVTRTRPENAVPAIRVILRTMEELTTAPPAPDEVDTTVDQIVNGFVFSFDTPGQIVARSMAYLAQELPDDWLERYVAGVQRVTPNGVLDAFSGHLHPSEMTILIVGDPDRIGREALESLGPVTFIEVR